MDLEKMIPQWDEYRKWIILFNKTEEEEIAEELKQMNDDKKVGFMDMHEYIQSRPKPLRPSFEGFMDWLSNRQIEVDENGHDMQCSSSVGFNCDCWRKENIWTEEQKKKIQEGFRKDFAKKK